MVSVTQGKVLRIKHGMKTCKVIPGMARLKALGCHPDHEPQIERQRKKTLRKGNMSITYEKPREI